MDIQKLIRDRGPIIEAAKEIINLARGEKRDVTADEERELNVLQGRLDTLSELINAEERYEDFPMWRDVGFAAVCADLKRSLKETDAYWEKRLNGSTNISGSSKSKYPKKTFVDSSNREHKGVNPDEKILDVYPARSFVSNSQSKIEHGSFGRMLRAQILGDATRLSDVEMRVMGEGTGSMGGWFVPSMVSNFVIDAARQKACCVQAGAITLPIDAPEMTFIKVVSDPTAYWRAENKAITESDGLLEPVHIKAVALAALVRVSLELLQDSPQAAQAIEDMLTASIALELDRAALFGSGAGEPKGLYSCKNIQSYSMGANGAALSNYDPFSYASQYVFEQNGQANAAIMAPRTWGAIDRLKEATTNAPLVAPASYAALQTFVTSQVPIDLTQGSDIASSCAFVGDFSKMVFCIRQNMTIETSREASDVFSKNQVLIRAIMRVDIALLRENHFTKIIGIK